MTSFIPPLTRRHVLQSAAAAGALSLVPWPLRAALAGSRAPDLSGTEFQLEIGPVPMPWASLWPAWAIRLSPGGEEAA